MNRAALLCTSVVLMAQPVSAQVRSIASLAGDQRVQTVEYHANQVVRLAAAPGYQLTVALAPDEQIQTVAVGDSGAWQVTASKDGNHLFVKPVGQGAPTDMTVITNVRRYTFELEALAGPSPEATYAVRFEYPKPAAVAAMPVKVEGRYRLHGARSLMPIRISDDGTRTFLEWSRDVDLPAVYMVDGQGREALVNGMFRDDRLVIDAVVQRLVFRIDKQVARAVRLSPEAARR